MNPETAAALEESIAHWKRMREDPDACKKRGESVGDKCCALCKLFMRNRWVCKRCPVSAVTGAGCRTAPSPWRAANWAWYEYHVGGSGGAGELAAWREAADAEIAFLEGLRDA